MLPWDEKLDDWRSASCAGVDESGAWVYVPPPYCGGRELFFQLVFTFVGNESATGIVTIADFALDWGARWMSRLLTATTGGQERRQQGRQRGRREQSSEWRRLHGAGSDGDAAAGETRRGQAPADRVWMLGATGGEAGGGVAGVETDAPLAAHPARVGRPHGHRLPAESV